MLVSPFYDFLKVKITVSQSMVPLPDSSGTPGINKEMVKFTCVTSEGFTPEMSSMLVGLNVYLFCVSENDSTNFGAMAPVQLLGTGTLSEHEGELGLHLAGYNSGLNTTPSEDTYYFLYVIEAVC